MWKRMNLQGCYNSARNCKKLEKGKKKKDIIATATDAVCDSGEG